MKLLLIGRYAFLLAMLAMVVALGWGAFSSGRNGD